MNDDPILLRAMREAIREEVDKMIRLANIGDLTERERQIVELASLASSSATMNTLRLYRI